MDFVNRHREIFVLGVILLGLIGLTALNRQANDTNSENPESAVVEQSEEASPDVMSSEETESNETSDDTATANQAQEPSAQDAQTPSSSNNDNYDAEQAKTRASDDYSYTAQRGDSYSELARKAVQTFGITDKANLSQAQIIAAETWLSAGKEDLNEGQSVTLIRAEVREAVERAMALTAEQQAMWGRYVAGVNFDTSLIGESR